jgi:hypothetical protein
MLLTGHPWPRALWGRHCVSGAPDCLVGLAEFGDFVWGWQVLPGFPRLNKENRRRQ